LLYVNFHNSFDKGLTKIFLFRRALLGITILIALIWIQLSRPLFPLIVICYQNKFLNKLIRIPGPPFRDSLSVLTHYPYWFTYPYFKSMDKWVDLGVGSTVSRPKWTSHLPACEDEQSTQQTGERSGSWPRGKRSERCPAAEWSSLPIQLRAPCPSCSGSRRRWPNQPHEWFLILGKAWISKFRLS